MVLESYEKYVNHFLLFYLFLSKKKMHSSFNIIILYVVSIMIYKKKIHLNEKLCRSEVNFKKENYACVFSNCLIVKQVFFCALIWFAFMYFLK